ncbi:twin-arginine translocase TatA/TatE family subunit [Vulgatibacter incomptus]|uniref:Twin-arginine translocation protein TatA n=1 Tax=Vulgatibacter incomptus TaxID=1391653 RepID=A0A0K1P9H3_9BACT|nr:twin-arginine translocase TatA/TatE family subunit [Vulgatibacter incomptus]AKU90188.1 hypothetical protein AKJ08_0575 [Vulgatibacter incomptus]
MVLPNLGELLIIGFVVFLIFGAVKVPALGEAIGVRLSRSRSPRKDDRREG